MTIEERNLYDYCLSLGHRAASIDSPASSNPFTEGTPQHRWWSEGWRNYRAMAEVA
jgi:hypothetical protein